MNAIVPILAALSGAALSFYLVKARRWRDLGYIVLLVLAMAGWLGWQVSRAPENWNIRMLVGPLGLILGPVVLGLVLGAAGGWLWARRTR